MRVHNSSLAVVIFEIVPIIKNGIATHFDTGCFDSNLRGSKKRLPKTGADVMLKSFLIIPLIVSLLTVTGTGFSQELPGNEILHGWVQDMKQAPRGPFNRIRWFCNDGAVLPPEKYACKEHGGGVQHGELSDRAARLRGGGFYVANIFADLKPPELLGDPGHLDIITQMILEQFLISADDGCCIGGSTHWTVQWKTTSYPKTGDHY